MRYLKCSSEKTTTNLEFYTNKTILQKWKGNEGLVWSTRNAQGSSQAGGTQHRSETWIHIMKGSVSPDQGWSPCPLQWKHRALPSGLPEKSPDQFFFLFLVHLKKKKSIYKIIIGNNARGWEQMEGDMSDTASPGSGIHFHEAPAQIRWPRCLRMGSD